MPRKSSGPPSGAQQRNARNIARNTATEYRASVAEYNKQKKAAEKRRRAEAKAREKELQRLMKKAHDTGLYNPKSNELTKYRKHRLRQLEISHGEYLTTDKYFFLPANKQARKQIIERAHTLQIVTSRTGIFYPKEGHRSASIKKNEKRGEFFIERRGKTKSGINKGRKYRDVTPLTTIDELDKERARLERAARRLGPLARGERLVFKVVENGVEGYSHGTFSSMEHLFRYLEKYPKNVAARVNFYRHIKIEKSTITDWNTNHPPRSPGAKERRQIGQGKFSTRASKG